MDFYQFFFFIFIFHLIQKLFHLNTNGYFFAVFQTFNRLMFACLFVDCFFVVVVVVVHQYITNILCSMNRMGKFMLLFQLVHELALMDSSVHSTFIRHTQTRSKYSKNHSKDQMANFQLNAHKTLLSAVPCRIYLHNSKAHTPLVFVSKKDVTLQRDYEWHHLSNEIFFPFFLFPWGDNKWL